MLFEYRQSESMSLLQLVFHVRVELNIWIAVDGKRNPILYVSHKFYTLSTLN